MLEKELQKKKKSKCKDTLFDDTDDNDEEPLQLVQDESDVSESDSFDEKVYGDDDNLTHLIKKDFECLDVRFSSSFRKKPIRMFVTIFARGNGKFLITPLVNC
ncbi:hypothetical protein HHI36_005295 [Cryptolaemus montrouzieri]|uniref:Uncharacterized protein n=1 Tax=Cryptolaemus montrouzieri TaxID=559131 RepID=A0ABD2NTP0_9CUCU